MSTGSRPHGRLFYFIALLFALAAATLAARAQAQGPQKTQITDVVYRPDGTPAQGTLLISWGRSRLAVEANNYFGIKAHGDLPFVEFRTTEVAGAVPYRTTAYFARYDSMAECFADRDAILARLACYGEARAQAATPELFLRALAKHWATDPNYATKVLAIYRAHRLDVLDRE